jgi:serine protease 16
VSIQEIMIFSFQRLGALLVVVSLVSPAHSLRPFRYLDILNTQDAAADADLSSSSSSSSSPDDVQELHFVQRLDHFDPLNMRTYQQRYFVTDRYIVEDARRSVTFLCVGGEGPGFTKHVLKDSVHCTGDMLELAHTLSQSYGISVRVYALEHRYYGKSYPVFDDEEVSPVTTQHLKYLSSRQALEDLAHFVQSMNVEVDTEMDGTMDSDDTSTGSSSSSRSTSTSQWVTFGGSYPGFMAAQARLKYPHLLYAAVSSSAPLDLKVDFPEYNQRVGWDLQYDKIGGSQQCLEIVKQGHSQAVAMVQEGRSETLANMFHVCEPETALLDKKNQNLLLGDGLIGVYVQGNDPSCDQGELCNVERLCHYMTDEQAKAKTHSSTTELEILAKVANKQRGLEDDCITVDYQQLLREISEPKVDEGGMRSWLWQTCTEVGFYQTCSDDTCPYANFYHLVDMDLDICLVAYNVTNVYENVQATLDHYGGLDISAGSRVLSVNGNVDPWSTLAVKTSPKYSLPAEIVHGASHHFWTHPVKDTDASEIVQVREYIYSVVMDWLGINGTKATSPLLRGGGHSTSIN